MGAQRYTSAVALGWMGHGRCPECGGYPRDHDGWGGPKGCTLTDGGVAERVAQYRADTEAAIVARAEGLLAPLSGGRHGCRACGLQGVDLGHAREHAERGE